jgi:hypothetical protein
LILLRSINLKSTKVKKVNIILLDELGQFGDAGYIQTEQTKEERDAKAPKSFLGNVKVVWTNGQNVAVTPREGEPQQKSNVDILQTMAENNTPDLPF